MTDVRDGTQLPDRCVCARPLVDLAGRCRYCRLERVHIVAKVGRASRVSERASEDFSPSGEAA